MRDWLGVRFRPLRFSLAPTLEFGGSIPTFPPSLAEFPESGSAPEEEALSCIPEAATPTAAHGAHVHLSALLHPSCTPLSLPARLPGFARRGASSPRF